jgi:RNA polymerase sigma-70 factor, ECF subfamily
MRVSEGSLDGFGSESRSEVPPGESGDPELKADQLLIRKTAPSCEPIDSVNKQTMGLMERIATGDEAALAELYRQLAPTLMGLALKMIGDQKEAEDVLQEGFIYIWRKAADYNPLLGRPTSWAARIMRSKAIDRLRVRRRNERLVERATIEFTHSPDTEETSAEDLIFGEKRAVVQAALGQIPPEQRQALELAFFGGLTQKEIAIRLAVPLGTIKARIRRGLIRLRDYIMESR